MRKGNSDILVITDVIIIEIGLEAPKWGAHCDQEDPLVKPVKLQFELPEECQVPPSVLLQLMEFMLHSAEIYRGC